MRQGAVGVQLEGFFDSRLGCQVLVGEAQSPALHSVRQRVVGVLEQGVLGIGDGFLILPGKDLDTRQGHVEGGIVRIGEDSLLVRLDGLRQLAFVVELLRIRDEGLRAARGGGGRDEERRRGGHHHLVEIQGYADQCQKQQDAPRAGTPPGAARHAPFIAS